LYKSIERELQPAADMKGYSVCICWTKRKRVVTNEKHATVIGSRNVPITGLTISIRTSETGYDRVFLDNVIGEANTMKASRPRHRGLGYPWNDNERAAAFKVLTPRSSFSGISKFPDASAPADVRRA